MTTLRNLAVGFALLVGVRSGAQVAQMYTANENQNELEQVNFVTGQVTVLYKTLPKPDDLILNSAGKLIYSLPNYGQVDMWDPVTGINTILASGINGARDLEIEPGGNTMLIAKYSSPAQIERYTFATNSWTVFLPSSSFIKGGTCDGITYDVYGNLYAVASHNTIIQINPVTGAIINTLTIEAHSGVNGGDGLTYDSYTNSLWATHDGKTLGIGLLQIPVQSSGFASTSPGFTFYPAPGIGNMDGLKSDGLGNLYIGQIFTAGVYNIPSNKYTYSVIVKGADGVALVPGT